ncbi:hypothetical protein EXIGLDRAFT_779703 [Exidia glandulosa HHB12029]|uniref:Uncharacterized protein n=1 Tax=Exidia glandulosa HHB12029 TaxID=1314781 RepID=A0A165BXZ4_EXIGL|nr:hypothetical protein EXIGLDRAFT_779703 [Exidia glandulosa HHB12029]
MSVPAGANPSINPATGVAWADGDTIRCECNIVVNVGKGGYGNLARHKQYKPHREAMTTKNSKKMDSFFVKKQKLPTAAAPAPLVPQPPSPLQASTSGGEGKDSQVHSRASPAREVEIVAAVATAALTAAASGNAGQTPETEVSNADKNKWEPPPSLAAFRRAISQLPDDVPFCDEDDARAEFAYGPWVDPQRDAGVQLEEFLDVWLPFDDYDEELIPLITRGVYGLDRVCDWLFAYYEQFLSASSPASAELYIKRFTTVLDE